MLQKTKILCTIGPACSDEKTLLAMQKAGMSAIRINTAHGTAQDHAKHILLAQKLKIPVVLDIKGPEMRIRLKNEMILKKGEFHAFGFNPKDATHFSYDFSKEVHAPSRILFDNGKIETRLVKYEQGCAVLQVINEGTLLPNKAVTIPGKRLKVPFLSAKDKEAMILGKKEQVAFFALSFVRSKEDVEHFHSTMRRLPGKNYPYALIAKIENRQGVDNLKDIASHVHGIMVARGDLSVEIPYEQVPETQKKILRECTRRGILDICATEMLESMITNTKPTNAEITDIHNAILDGADCLMLSGETAVGKDPILAVSTMARIAKRVEGTLSTPQEFLCSNTSDSLTTSIGCIAHNADFIVCVTRSGYTARRVSGNRPTKPILAVTSDPIIFQQLKLDWGITPVLAALKGPNKMAAAARHLLAKKHITKNKIILLIGSMYTKGRSIDTISIITAKEAAGQAGRLSI